MSDDLFRTVSQDRAAGAARRGCTVPISAAVHALIVIAVIAIPLAAVEVPSLPSPEIAFVQPVDPPSPPPAPIPRTSASAARRTLLASKTAPPIVAPASIGSENGLLIVPDPPGRALSDNAGTVWGGTEGGLPDPTLKPVEPPPPAVPPLTCSWIQHPRKIHDVQPVYPDLAQKARIEGMVIIEAIISQTGQVREARVLRGVPLLDGAALEAVRQWVYAPALLNGQPVAVVMTVMVNFKLK